jgi:hypothetical protein
MKRTSTWLAVLVVGAFLVGCSGPAASLSPGGTGGALLGAWAAPNGYDMVGEVTIDNGTVDAHMACGIGFGWFFAKAIEDDQRTPFDLQPFYQSEGLMNVSIGDFEDVENSWVVNGEYCLKQLDDKLSVHAGVFGGLDIGVTAGADYQVLDDLNISADWTTQGSLSGVGIGVTYVATVADQRLAAQMGLDLDTSTSAGGEALSVGMDYYLNRELSLGVTFGDLTGGVTYEARAKYFTGPMAVSAGYTVLPGADVVSGAVEYRF